MDNKEFAVIAGQGKRVADHEQELKIKTKHTSKSTKTPKLLEYLYNLVLENNIQSLKQISVLL